MHAALIRGPQLAALHARAEPRRDRTGPFRPPVAHALPALVRETPIYPAERPATYAEYSPDDAETTTTSDGSRSIATLRTRPVLARSTNIDALATITRDRRSGQQIDRTG